MLSESMNPQQCLLIQIALLLIALQAVKSQEADQQFEYVKSSDPAAFQVFGRSEYSNGTIFFGKLNDESDELMISLEYPGVKRSSKLLTISKWLSSGEREVIWTAKDDRISHGSILVGNIDSDPYEEILMFRGNSMSTRTDLFVIEWVDEEFQVIKHSNQAPHAAALIDVNLDGINEVVFASVRTDIDHGYDNTYPSMLLQIYSVGQTLGKIQEITLEDKASVRTLVTYDLNGDGYKEIITVEYTPGPKLDGQLSIYAARETNRIVRVHVENLFFPLKPRYIDLFEHDLETYMFVELDDLKWKTILRWRGFQYPLEERWENTDFREFHLLEKVWQRHLVFNPFNEVIEKYRSWKADITKSIYVTRDVDDVRTGTPHQIFLEQ